MNGYLKRYIELKQQFDTTNHNPESVRAFYVFKEELEQEEDKQAKEVRVNVYNLFDFKKSAYDLLCQIGDCSDPKVFKRLAAMKDYAENWGHHYAIRKPKTREEKQKDKNKRKKLGLPVFRYHPAPLETGAFEESADGVACDCCGKAARKFYLTQTGEEMDNPFPFSVRQGLNFSDTCMVRTRDSLMAVQQDRGSSPIELWDTGSGQLLTSIDDPFVVRQTDFAFTKSGLVLHTDYGAMSIYSCAR